MTFKQIINKLKNPVEVNKSTLFPREIKEIPFNFYKTKKKYLKERFTKEDRILRNTEIILSIQMLTFISMCSGLIYLAINK